MSLDVRSTWERLTSRFFDSTPSGRIMNRLSKDMASVDTETAESEYICFGPTNLQSCSTLCSVCFPFSPCWPSLCILRQVRSSSKPFNIVLLTPVFLAPLVVISVMYWAVGALYVETTREIKRFDVSRVPHSACQLLMIRV